MFKYFWILYFRWPYRFQSWRKMIRFQLSNEKSVLQLMRVSSCKVQASPPALLSKYQRYLKFNIAIWS